MALESACRATVRAISAAQPGAPPRVRRAPSPPPLRDDSPPPPPPPGAAPPLLNTSAP
ncbi:toxin, partial [Curtobacterium sp. MCLR17_057]